MAINIDRDKMVAKMRATTVTASGLFVADTGAKFFL
jgi:hypothetical protein